MAAQQIAVGDVGYRIERGGSLGRAWRGVWSFARAKPMGAIGGAVLLIMALVAVFAPWIAPYSPTATNQREALEPPSLQHLFGTDQFGRDVFSRVVYGARVSLFVGLGVTAATLILATIIGMCSAYFGGALDYFVQRFVDAVQAVPGLILLISVMVVLGPGLLNVMVALALRSSITTSRVIRSTTLTVKANPYVEAAAVVGATHSRVMLRHIVPNIVPPAIIVASVQFGGAILAEAALSFLGFGVPPPTPTWGGMLSSEGRAFMVAAPWILVFPAIALSMTIFSVNMLGDALRDRLDPRLRGGGGRLG